jgi:hypothetical protein
MFFRRRPICHVSAPPNRAASLTAAVRLIAAGVLFQGIAWSSTYLPCNRHKRQYDGTLYTNLPHYQLRRTCGHRHRSATRSRAPHDCKCLLVSPHPRLHALPHCLSTPRRPGDFRRHHYHSRKKRSEAGIRTRLGKIKAHMRPPDESPRPQERWSMSSERLAQFYATINKSSVALYIAIPFKSSYARRHNNRCTIG